MIKMGKKDIARQIDADMINEIGNILSNNSANAFSKMMKDNINIQTEVELISTQNFNMEMVFTKDFAEIFKDLTNNYVEGYFLKTTEGVEGMSVLLFHKEHINELIKQVSSGMGVSGKDKMDDEEKIAVLKEFTSICLNAYLTALSNLIEIKISATTPIPARDILGSLYDFREHLKEANSEEALMIKTDITASATGIDGKLVMLLEPRSLTKILQVLNKKAAGEYN